MTGITLDGLRLRERELEIDAVLIRGRVLEIRMMIEEEERRRGGRPKKPTEVTTIKPREATDTPNGPHGLAGAIFETPTDQESAA